MDYTMSVHKVSKEATAEYKWFGKYPLLGSAIISDRSLEKIHSFAKQYIDMIVQDPKLLRGLTLKAKMQITLSLIDYTKNWDSSQNSQFWNYIALQYGYRDNNGSVIKLLQTCVQDSMESNSRWFLKGKYNREFMATLVIHALSPKKSWFRLMDFLFDFYQENLQWDYVPNDPIIGTMTQALKQKLDRSNDNKQDDMEFTISNKAYSFQQGVWKLVTMQPEYAEVMFNHILAYMNQMIEGEIPKVRTYEEALCKEWYEQRLSVSLNNAESRRKVRGAKREIAFGYTQIHPRFFLLSDDFGIIVPDVRIAKDKLDKAYINVHINDELVSTDDFEYYGNELGRTLIGKSISLLPYTKLLEDGIKVRVTIVCDGDIEYDSREYLYRKAVLFDEGKEIPFSSCKSGKQFSMLLSEGAESQFKNVSIEDSKRYNGVVVQQINLVEGFFISIDRKALAIDYVDNQQIQLTLPKPIKDVSYRLDGEEYAVIDEKSGVVIHARDIQSAKRYQISLDGLTLHLTSDNYHEEATGIEVFVPLEGENSNKELHSVQIVDLANQEILYSGSYFILPTISVSYNKSLYVFDEDYENACAKVVIGTEELDCPILSESNELSIPFGNGELISAIPCAKLEIYDEPWGYEQVFWHEEIEDETIIKLIENSGCNPQLYLDNEIIKLNSEGCYAIGQSISDRNSDHGEKSCLYLHYTVAGSRKRRMIGEIYWSDTFSEKTKVWSKDNTIYWNLGGEFIGDESADFYIKFTDSKRHAYDYPIKLKEKMIAPFDEIMEGSYHYSIIKIVDEEEKILSEGDCVLGDINNIRFKDKVIRIGMLTDDENALTHIKPVFIEDIEFFDVMDTSEGLCPVYYGQMYNWIASTKKKIPFANRKTVKENPGFELVNPVRIVYINDSVLCITNDEGEGLYYHWNYIASQDRQVFELTDRAYTKKSKSSYGLADLYRYEIFR